MTPNQSLLFDVDEYDVQSGGGADSDDWETPDGTGGSMRLAQTIASLIPSVPGNQILEPAAGTGRIAQYLPDGAVCFEIKTARVAKGQGRAPHCHWHQGDFLKAKFDHEFKVVVSNPPFSCAIEFLAKTEEVLERGGEVFFLLPMSFFSPKGRANQLQELEDRGLMRTVLYPIAGRVGYLWADIPCPGRQCDDAVHRFVWNKRAKSAITTLFC